MAKTEDTMSIEEKQERIRHLQADLTLNMLERQREDQKRIQLHDYSLVTLVAIGFGISIAFIAIFIGAGIALEKWLK